MLLQLHLQPRFTNSPVDFSVLTLVAIGRAYHATQAKHENDNILSVLCKHGYGVKGCCGMLRDRLVRVFIYSNRW